MRGGKVIYGAALGILMLEAWFCAHPRRRAQCDDVAVPDALPVVRAATPEGVVRHNADGLMGSFVAAAVGVPVATSSLMQWRWSSGCCRRRASASAS